MNKPVLNPVSNNLFSKTGWVYLVLALGSLVMLLPFWVMLATSLLTQQESFQTPPKLFPWPMHFENYQRLFETIPVARYFWNSLWVSIVTTVFQVLLSAMAAYGFARFEFKGKNILFFVFLITLMVPPQVNLVPLFFMMKAFHWIDTVWALIVPGLFSAFGVFLLKQWFQGIPKDLEESAKLDGCNPWQIFWQVILPLSTPALASLAIFAFIGSWNSFMWPLIVTFSDDLRTLPLGIAALKSSFRDTTDWPLMMAATTISVLPVVLVYLIGQRYFIRGIMAGGVKG